MSPTLRLWSEREISLLRQAMDRSIEDLCLDLGLEPPSALDRPEIRLEDRGDCLEAFLSAPGLCADDLKLELLAKRLDVSWISGESTPGGQRRRAFHRRIALPCGVDAEKVSATLQKGVLVIQLPKAQPTRRRIAID